MYNRLLIFLTFLAASAITAAPSGPTVYDTWVAKLAEDGVNTEIIGSGVDRAGNTYLGGRQYYLTKSGKRYTGYYSRPFTARFDRKGNLAWFKPQSEYQQGYNSATVRFMVDKQYGTTFSLTRVNNDYLLTKRYSNGTVDWSTAPKILIPTSLFAQDSSNGHIHEVFIAGRDSDGFKVTKYDSGGRLSWTHKISRAMNYNTVASATNDGSVIVTGMARSESGSSWGLLTYAISGYYGNELWSSFNEEIDYPYTNLSSIELISGNIRNAQFYVIGSRYDYNSGNYSPFVIRYKVTMTRNWWYYSYNVEPVWTDAYTTERNHHAYLSNVEMDRDRNLYLLGRKQIYRPDGNKGKGYWEYSSFLVKYASSGSEAAPAIAWDKTIVSGREFIFNPQMTFSKENDIYLATRHKMNINADEDFLVTSALNSDGTELWRKTHRLGGAVDLIQGIHLDSLGDVYVASSVYKYPYNSKDRYAYVLKYQFSEEGEVLRTRDVRNPNITTVETDAIGFKPTIYGDTIVFNASECESGKDLNADGDIMCGFEQGVLGILKPTADGYKYTNTGVAMFCAPGFYGNIAAFISSEELMHEDFDGDGDQDDRTVQLFLYDTDTNRLIRPGVFADSCPAPDVSGKRVSFSTDERYAGDLNGDGFYSSYLISIYNIETGELSFVPEEAAQEVPSLDNNLVAYEDMNNDTDVDGDGVIDGSAIKVYNLDTGEFHIPSAVPYDYPTVSNGIVSFIGRNRWEKSTLYYYDTVTRETVNTGIPAYGNASRCTHIQGDNIMFFEHDDTLSIFNIRKKSVTRTGIETYRGCYWPQEMSIYGNKGAYETIDGTIGVMTFK